MPVSRQRNQAMECYKMIAAILVVILHAPFPGRVESFFQSFCSFAVPVFFAITGYFNYGADQKTLGRRLKHLLKLYLATILVSVFIGMVLTELDGGSSVSYLRSYMPEMDELVMWLTIQRDPRNGQLWYLSAVCFCYVVLWLYVGFYGKQKVNYHPLYAAALSLAVVKFAISDLGSMMGKEVPFLMIRNGYFKGLPMFMLGMFFREYQDQIFENFHITTRKAVLLILGGCALNLMQWSRMGTGDVSVGAKIEIVGILLLLISHPVVVAKEGFRKRCIGKFGLISTWTYLLHIQMLLIYNQLLRPSLLARLGENESWWRPGVVVALSLMAALIFTWGEGLLLKRRRSKVS